MIFRIEVRNKEGIIDPRSSSISGNIRELGITSVRHVDVADVFYLHGELALAQAVNIAEQILRDYVTQKCIVCDLSDYQPPVSAFDRHYLEIAYHPGVMDPVEHSTLKAIRDLGHVNVEAVRTAKFYGLEGKLSGSQVRTLADKILSNKLIQHQVAAADIEKSFHVLTHEYVPRRIEVKILKAADKDLERLSKDGQLYLSLAEMKAIQNHFRSLKREPTDAELETIAQTWSEHCYHKTFRGNIDYEDFSTGQRRTKHIKNLFKSTIAKATREIARPWCVSVFHDNAGVIKFDNDHHVCFKVETHNHPSALEPFGGANTGIGGVVRDILGTGLGAKPIANTDIFCFAPPDMSFDELPPGTLHPRRVMNGVVSGVRDYGNKMGIPTVNGAIVFDRHFVGNPLVYCGNVGLIPKDKVKKEALKGDLVVVAGGRTGRDGIHGATFSSGELTDESETVSCGAVQIGNPIEEKKILDALMKARDEGLYTSITDCGAGGLSSAAGEMGKDLGVRIQLDEVPLKYQGLSYAEIWISESQERMVMSVLPKHIQRLMEIFATENVEATVIGEFTGRGRLELFYEELNVGDLDMAFLHEGHPHPTKKAVWKAPKIFKVRLPPAPPTAGVKVDLTESLLNVLSHYNVCSKESVVRVYDHEVQGGSVIKPFAGINCDGPSDASVVVPKLGSNKGAALSNGINIRFGMIDPFWMAASCVDEAVRQIVVVGGDPEKIAILDNFCWGNPDKPDRLGSLVRCAEGCYKAAVGYRTPLISGKDSLYNEYTEGGKSIAIPGTILISAIGIIDDISKCVTMDFKEPGNLIYAIGTTRDELGGSIYLETLGALGSDVPWVDFKTGRKIFALLHKAMQAGLIRSAHDCSEGGLAVALAEMAFAGGFGATLRLDNVPYKGSLTRDDVILFSESNTRFVVEVPAKHKNKFEKIFKGIPAGLIGQVEKSPEFVVYGRNRNVCINAYIQELKTVWQRPLKNQL